MRYLINTIASACMHEECKRVIAERTIESFSLFFDKVDNKKPVISFVVRQLDSPRKTLKKQAEAFLAKFG